MLLCFKYAFPIFKQDIKNPASCLHFLCFQFKVTANHLAHLLRFRKLSAQPIHSRLSPPYYDTGNCPHAKFILDSRAVAQR